MTFQQIKEFFNITLITIDNSQITIGDVLIIPIVLFIIFFITKLFVRQLARRLSAKKIDPNLTHLIQRLIYVIAIIIMVITTLDLLNIPITAFAFLSGAIAIGFGFGAQNIINNFISGWILMWERPIKIGDFLEIDEAKGIVETINTRSTLIRRVDGVHMLIPNSKLLENTVVNWTLVDRLVRSSVKVGVAYGSPVKKVSELIMQAAIEQEGILKDPLPVVYFEDFGDNALVFEVNFWIHSQVEGGLRLMRSDIRYRIDELFAENNLVIAYPQRDVHIDGSIKLIK
ncbi:mechanosensitive ion channel family protein [Thalassotalea agariperforans]